MRIATIVIALAVSAVAAPAQGPELALAQVRPDGILVPFAVFDGAKWVDAWPEPSDKHRLDRMIAAVPSYWRERQRQVPQVWHAADFPSHKPRATKVLSHVMFDEHCAIQVGLLTDLPRSGENPHEKKLAMSWPSPIEWHIDVLANGVNRAPWQPLIDAALSEAAQGERMLKPPSGGKPLGITKVYGFLDGNVRVIYYEAERKYVEPAVLYASGWIIAASGGTPRAFESQTELGDGDVKGLTTLEPLGIIRPAGTGLWIVQEHGYETEAVSLLQIGADGIPRVFSKFVGGC